MNNQNYFTPSAFISCSLRKKDQPFVSFIEEILTLHYFTPLGTVGRYDVAPISTAELMRVNIPKSDIIVVVATPRYVQTDIQSGQVSSSISEMLHIESGMAYACNKPIVVFAQEGTHVGNFLPTVTQYITLTGTQADFEAKWPRINSLLGHAYKCAYDNRNKQPNADLGKLFTAGLAFWGGLKIIESLSEDTPVRRTPYKKTKRKKSRY